MPMLRPYNPGHPFPFATSHEQKALPEDWRWVRLGDVIREAQAGFARGERDANGVIQLRMNNVTTSGRLDWNSFIRVPADSVTIERYQLEPGDVMFNNTNSTELVGKTALFEGYKEPVVYSNHFTRLRTKDDTLDPRFLAFWLQEEWRRRVFADICNRWIGQSAVKSDKLLALEIPIPPLSEQRRVAARLNEIMAEIGRARAAAQAALDAANKLDAAWLTDAFMSEQSKSWREVKIGEVCKRRTEIVHPNDGTKGRLRFVGLEHIEAHTGHRIGEAILDAEALDGRKPRFYQGDVVYGYLRPYLNKVWVAEFDGVSSVDQYAFAVNPNLADPKFVAYYLRSPLYLRRAPINVTPGFLPRIRSEEVEGTLLPLPSLTEQRQVVARLDAGRSAASQSRGAAQVQLDTINALPAVYLRRAFKGEL